MDFLGTFWSIFETYSDVSALGAILSLDFLVAPCEVPVK